MTRFSKKKKIIVPPAEAKIPKLSEHILKSLDRPIKDFVDEELKGSIISMDDVLAAIEMRIHEKAKEHADSVRMNLESLDEELAQGLPLMSKKQKEHSESIVKKLNEDLKILDKAREKRFSELEKRRYTTPEDFKTHKVDVENLMKQHKDFNGKELKSLGETYRKLGNNVEKHGAQFKRVDSIVKKIARDLKKSKEVFEFGYSMGVSKNGVFQGNTGFLNFRNGTNTTARVVSNGGGFDIFVDSTGGSGSGFQQVISGTVDGSNKVFVFATAPNAISVDEGRTIQKIASDGISQNWTGTTTVTLSVAPNFDIFAIA